jgi:hypothetical protein
MLVATESSTLFSRLIARPLRDVALAVSLIGPRGWVLAVTAAVVAALVTGTVAAIFKNPYFARMTPVRVQDYVIWIASAALVGLVAGTYIRPAGVPAGGKFIGGGLLSFLAIGCPICNKLVVLLLGVSGALTFFAPVQLYIGIGSVLLLLWALRLRAEALVRSCAIA